MATIDADHHHVRGDRADQRADRAPRTAGQDPPGERTDHHRHDHRRDQERNQRRTVGPEARRCSRRARRGTPTSPATNCSRGSISNTSPASENTSAATNHVRRASAPAARSAARPRPRRARPASPACTRTRRAATPARIARRARDDPVADREHRRDDRTRRPATGSMIRQPCQTGAMAFHHVAITTKDLDATHRFYTEAMGFDLVKVEAQHPTRRIGLGPAPLLRHRQRRDARGLGHPRRDARQAVPDRDLHRARPAAVGNHIAFNSPDLDDLDAAAEALARQRPRLRAHRPRLVHVDLRRRPQRHHGGVLHVDPRVHRRRPRRGQRCSRRVDAASSTGPTARGRVLHRDRERRRSHAHGLRTERPIATS